MIQDTSIEGIALAAVQMYTLVSEQMKGLAQAKGNTDFQSSDEVKDGDGTVPDVTSYAIDVAYHEAMHAWVELNRPAPQYGKGKPGPRYERDYTSAVAFLQDVSEREPGTVKSVFQIMAHWEGMDWDDKSKKQIIQGKVLEQLVKAVDDGFVEDIPNGATTSSGKKVPGYKYIPPADESPADKNGLLP